VIIFQSMQGCLRAMLLALATIGTATDTEVLFSAEQPGTVPRQAVEEIIHDYILKHPDVILESMRLLRERQRTAEKERAREAIIARREELLHDPTFPTGGNRAGDITIVEFFDYCCPHCKAAFGTVKKLLQDDSNLRFVYKEFLVLGEESLLVAKAALAAHGQDRYLPFHEALMESAQPLTMPVVLQMAKIVGLDVEELKAQMEAPEITAIIEKNRVLARSLGISGTPAFVIGSELIPGAVDYPSFKELVTREHSK
jgi:protein-disulfide isomerase